MTDKEKYQINRRYELAVRNLNPKAWEVMYPTEKLADLQAIEDKNAMDQGRIACEVCSESMEKGTWGYQQANAIVVNANELDNPNFMEHVDTLFHEGSHARDWQATLIPEVQSTYTEEQLAAVNTPIPDPDVNPDGYWNHPAEVAAREAGSQGVEKVLSDREKIVAYDEAHNEHINQILVTYDYVALDSAEQTTTGVETLNATQSAGESTDYTSSMDNVHTEDLGADMNVGNDNGQDEGYGY